MHGLRDHQNSADLGPTAWPSPPKRTPRDPRAPTHTQKLAPALLPSLSWATLTWNPPLGQLAWPETSRPLVLKSSDCPCLTSTPETYPQAGLASPSAVQGEQQQRRWGKGDRHIAPRGRGACTGHTGRGPAPVPRPPTVAGAGGRASRAARGHAILSVGSWRPSWQSPWSPGFTAAPGAASGPFSLSPPGARAARRERRKQLEQFSVIMFSQRSSGIGRELVRTSWEQLTVWPHLESSPLT